MSNKDRFEKKPKNSIPTNTLSFKERLSALSNIPSFLKMVWKTSPGMTLGSALLRLVRSAIPLAMLYVGKLIIDEVILLSKGESLLPSDHLWFLVALEFGLAIAADALNRSITLIDSLLGDLFSTIFKPSV